MRWHNAGIIETAARSRLPWNMMKERSTRWSEYACVEGTRLGCYGAPLQSRLYCRSTKQGQVCEDGGSRTGKIARTVRTALCSEGLVALTRSFRKRHFSGTSLVDQAVSQPRNHRKGKSP